VGASGWDYVVDLPESGPADPSAALAGLRERVLREGDFLWADWLGPRPTTLAELDATRDTAEFWEEGTHSVLDVDRVVGSDEPDGEGTVRPLLPHESVELFGTATPSPTDFVVAEADLWNLDVERWSGRCQVLYDDDDARPVAIGFWGVSGD
jgi:hypothetical protein